jgi:hypothetical protein
MNKKTRQAILFFGALIVFIGCTTTVKSVASPPGALEYREAQAEIRQQQAELAVTGVKIAEGSQSITEGILRLEESIAHAPQDPGEADRLNWLSQVQGLRARAEEHQAETERLNRQLAEERETTRRQVEIFEQRESAWQTAVSDRDTENTALKIDNAKISGQRNMTFVIAIALALVIVGYIVIRVLRFLRIIPV